ncbi:TIGR02611 family protein [Corynebacterium sp. ES2794-CONJ1]|uniref:TIGR02611 family protein n=1 Tax=Corynebacterium sp. ES2794-CONJ1 TaxID=2980553 RepID=UPI0021D813D1|nr:TIGR02611 family protein [Corynebacterium sp. ES2794-CONJ1]MCU9518888.1 TIGR02611 family protein [Corynebacterium sp. ES2794-CONJ1]
MAIQTPAVETPEKPHTTRDQVRAKIHAITFHHERMKTRRFGFLVRPLVLIAGWVVVILGLVTIPFPGPGWLTVFVGIGILSLESHLAGHLLGWAIGLYDRFFQWYRSKPRIVRYFLIFLICLVAWIMVGSTAVTMWSYGALPALDPVMQYII